VIDVAPTVLELAGIPEPAFVNGVAQKPIEGVSLAAELRDKLHELQRLWLTEAIRHDVLPLDDRRVERFNPDLAGRPQLINGTSQIPFAGMGRLTEASLINVKNKSHAVTAQVEVPASGAKGVIIAQGGAFGGWALYAKDGKPTYCHNLLGLQRFKVAGDQPVPPGAHQVRMEFDYEGGGLGKGGPVRLYVDGKQVGEGRLSATVPLIFSADETADIGRDTSSPVSDDYTPASSVFSGTVDYVQIDIGPADADHFISPEERLATLNHRVVAIAAGRCPLDAWARRPGPLVDLGWGQLRWTRCTPVVSIFVTATFKGLNQLLPAENPSWPGSRRRAEGLRANVVEERGEVDAVLVGAGT
jgi:hypothetical protein